MIRITAIEDYEPINFIILIAEWIFCIIVFITNILVALYGIVCGCCYTHVFEEIVNDRDGSTGIKTPFSFTVSNKVKRKLYEYRVGLDLPLNSSSFSERDVATRYYSSLDHADDTLFHSKQHNT